MDGTENWKLLFRGNCWVTAVDGRRIQYLDVALSGLVQDRNLARDPDRTRRRQSIGNGAEGHSHRCGDLTITTAV
jgi:hypothetical protein